MDKHSFSSSLRVVGDQAHWVVSSGPVCGSPTVASEGLDVILLCDLPEQLSYNVILHVVKPYGDMDNTTSMSNRCYVNFVTTMQAQLAFKAVGTFDLPDLYGEVLSFPQRHRLRLRSHPYCFRFAGPLPLAIRWLLPECLG